MRLREFTDNDIILVENWLKKEHVAKFFCRPESWLNELNLRKTDYSFIRHFIIEDDKPIGFCQYYDYSKGGEDWHGNFPIDKTYSIDYLIGEEKYLRRGFGTWSVAQLTKKIFEQTDAKNVIAQPEIDNIASRKTLLSAGFAHEKENDIYILEKPTKQGERTMFRSVRKDCSRILSLEEIIEVMEKANYGILSVNGEGGYPYGLPVNFLYKDYKLYMHGGTVGHKADSLRKDDKICFTVVGEEVILKETWAPFVKSVILFGKCHEVEDVEKSKEVIRALASKYYPPQEAKRMEATVFKDSGAVFEISIERITGKITVEK